MQVPVQTSLFRRQQKTLLCCLLLVVALLMGGCTTFLSEDKMIAEKVVPDWMKKKDVEPPVKVVTIWSDTILHQQGKPAIRGFGGRVYFYDAKDEHPIKVDGTLMVYAFDADDMNPNSPAPEKKFVFPTEHLAKHHSKTKVGDSYSVWLPWDEVGSTAKNISLVSRFESTDGVVLLSEPSNKLLPGPQTEIRGPVGGAESGYANKGSTVQQASFQQAATRESDSVTINLPPSFARHLKPSGTVAQEDRASDSLRNPQYQPRHDQSPLSGTAQNTEPSSSGYRFRAESDSLREKFRARTSTRLPPGDARAQRRQYRSALPSDPESLPPVDRSSSSAFR